MRQNVPLGKIPSLLTGAVFVLAAQPVDSPQENSFTYGDFVSGATIFAYVHGDPLNFTDPEGLFEWGDPLPDELVNICAGFGDGVSLGATSLVRSLMGTNDQVDMSSPEYLGGVVAGAVVTGKG
ncbi:hypothetical protein, partial [Ramlibacter sp.]|uniref:hypothetical protein n=1 Tax=Ramlibacter sp. TaxID=1917967 RepID=UPI00182DDE20